MQVVEDPQFRETDQSRRTLENLALQARIKAALRADPSTRNLGVSVDSDGGLVSLRGIVQTREESDGASRVAGSVDGVTGVKNELRITEEIRSRTTL
jgi:osmotically-inducible protein OsmY